MAAAPFAIAGRLSPVARLPVRAWRPAHGFASSGRARSLAVASAAQENRDNSVDVQVSQNGGNRQQGNAVQRRPRRATALDISPSPFGKSSFFTTGSPSKTEDCSLAEKRRLTSRG